MRDVGIDANGFRVVRNRLVILRLPLSGVAAVDESRCEVGLNAKNPRVVCRRSVQIRPPLQQQVGPLEVAFEEVLPEQKGTVEFLLRVDRVSILEPRIGTDLKYRRAGEIRPNRRREVGDGIVVHPLVGERVSPVVEDCGVVPIRLENLGIVGYRLVEGVLPGQGQPFFLQAGYMIRLYPQDLTVGRDRPVVVLRLDTFVSPLEIFLGGFGTFLIL